MSSRELTICRSYICTVCPRSIYSYSSHHLYNVCPRSSDPFYLVTYYTILVNTSWTFSTMCLKSLFLFSDSPKPYYQFSCSYSINSNKTSWTCSTAESAEPTPSRFMNIQYVQEVVTQPKILNRIILYNLVHVT